MLGLSPQQNLGLGGLGGLGGGLGTAGLGLGGGLGGALGGLGGLGGGLGTAGLGLGGGLGGALGGLGGGTAAGLGMGNAQAGGGQDSSSMFMFLFLILLMKSGKLEGLFGGGQKRATQRTTRNVTPQRPQTQRRDNDRTDRGRERREPQAAPIAKASVNNGALTFSDAQWNELQRALDNGGGAEQVKPIVDKALKEATDAKHPRDVLNKLYGSNIRPGRNKDKLVAKFYPEVLDSYVQAVMNQYGNGARGRNVNNRVDGDNQRRTRNIENEAG